MNELIDIYRPCYGFKKLRRQYGGMLLLPYLADGSIDNSLNVLNV